MKKSVIWNFKCIAISLVLGLGTVLHAEAIEVSKTLSKNAAVPEGTRIRIQNKSGDLDVRISDANTVKITTTVRLVGKSQEDLDKVMEAIDDFEFEQDGNEFEIDTRFWESMNSINGRTTMKLLNGEKVRISKFEVSHELIIPRQSELNLVNKYSDLKLADINSGVYLSQYDGKIVAGDFGSPSEIKMKYAKGSIGKCKDLELDLYDSDLIADEAGDVALKSKYSSLEVGKVANLKGQVYDDRLQIRDLGNGEITSKYSDFDFGGTIGSLVLNIYDDNFKGNNVKELTFTSKYSELTFEKIGSVHSARSYDDILKVSNLGSLNIEESKYSDYKIGTLNTSLFVSGYDDNISVENVKSGFKKIFAKGKYTSVSMDLESGASYNLLMDIKYPKVSLPDNLTYIEKIKEDDEIHVKANVDNGEANMTFEGYDMAVRISQ